MRRSSPKNASWDERNGVASSDDDVSMVTTRIPMAQFAWLEKAIRGVAVRAQKRR